MREVIDHEILGRRKDLTKGINARWSQDVLCLDANAHSATREQGLCLIDGVQTG